MLEQVLCREQSPGPGHEEDAGRNGRMRMKELLDSPSAGGRVGNDFSRRQFQLFVQGVVNRKVHGFQRFIKKQPAGVNLRERAGIGQKRYFVEDFVQMHLPGARFRDQGDKIRSVLLHVQRLGQVRVNRGGAVGEGAVYFASVKCISLQQKN